MKARLLFLLLAQIPLANAQDQGTQNQENQKIPPQVQKVLDELKWNTGKLALQDSATLTTRDGYRYLNGSDANRVLSELWRNLPSHPLGMVFPDNTGVLDYNWAVVIEGFENDGYVKDSDGDKIDQAALLKQLQDGQKQANEELKKEGRPELEIIKFAIPPHYDSATKKLYWAIDIKAIGSMQHDVNYHVRILGRHGYLVLTGIGSLDSVREIDAAMPKFLSMVEFNEGNRYADFNPKTDKVATYGIAGLIIGAVGLKLAAKAGILAVLMTKFGPILLALKKGLIFVIVAIGAFFKKIKSFFVRSKEDPSQT